MDENQPQIGLSSSDEPPRLLPVKRSKANKFFLGLTGGALVFFLLVTIVVMVMVWLLGENL